MPDRLSIDECRRLIASTAPAELPALIRRFEGDPRRGVADVVCVARRRVERARREHERLTGMQLMQSALHARGIRVVGRGALAGPLTAAAVVLPAEALIDGLDDSKKLTPEKRQTVAVSIRAVAVAWCVEHVSPEEIDHFGMTQAVRLAMRRALDGLGIEIGHVLVDGNDGRVGYPSTAVVAGDSKVAAIAAASVVAKVTRDALMVELDAVHPGYGFALHKGYSTVEHMAAIRTMGPSAVHRLSFAPCREDASLF
jgi:ribonuclease HII